MQDGGHKQGRRVQSAARALRRCAAHSVKQRLEGKGLGQKIIDPQLRRLRQHMIGHEGGDEKYLARAALAPQLVQDADAVRARQCRIQNKQLRLVRVYPFQNLMPIAGKLDRE